MKKTLHEEKHMKRKWISLVGCKFPSDEERGIMQTGISPWLKAARPAWRTLALAACVLAMGVSATAQGARTCRSIPIITNIDYPGGFQTEPVAISNTGWITGGRRGTDGRNHCFLRSPGGSYTDCEPGGVGAIASFAWSINTAGQIAGVYRDSNGVGHGFLRNADGSFEAPLDAPGAGIGNRQGTIAYNINPSGELAGDSIDSNGVYHSWVWVNGTFNVFDAPGGGTGSGQGTQVSITDGLDPFGNVFGATVDSSNANHGFVRYADGSFCSFDVAGGGTGAGQGTIAAGINQAGQIEGYVIDSNSVSHGYVGSGFVGGNGACGTTAPFDVPGAGTGTGQGTYPSNINALGEVVGGYVDSSNVNHGYVREPNGMITRFDAPGAGTGNAQGTDPSSNNASGQITGYYVDNLGKLHGFLRSCN